MAEINVIKGIGMRKSLGNFTEMEDYMFDHSKVIVGYGAYGIINAMQFDRDYTNLRTGNYSIALKISFPSDSEHFE